MTLNPTERSLLEAAAEANERIRTCHQVVACPRCGAPIGTRCYRVGRTSSWPIGGATPLKNPHQERWTQVQPAR